MIDSIKILLLPHELKCSWDVTELKKRLEPFEKFHRHGFKPLGFVRNVSVSGNNNILIVEGSLSKYYIGNNVENFDWKHIKPAIRSLSADIGLPLERGRLVRIDTAGNIGLTESVPDYFPELNYLRYYQRLNNKRTTLRFMSNRGNVNILFYDKLAENRSKNVQDIDFATLRGIKNLMRYEVQIQQRLASELGLRKIKVVHLYSTSFYEKLLKYWYLTTYCEIEKKALMILPNHIKGRKAIDRFIFRYFVENLGWQSIDAMFNNAQKNGSLSANDKSKKMRQLRNIMEDNHSFLFKEITYELNEKVAEMYLDASHQIHLIKQSNSKLI